VRFACEAAITSATTTHGRPERQQVTGLETPPCGYLLMEEQLRSQQDGSRSAADHLAAHGIKVQRRSGARWVRADAAGAAGLILLLLDGEAAEPMIGQARGLLVDRVARQRHAQRGAGGRGRSNAQWRGSLGIASGGPPGAAPGRPARSRELTANPVESQETALGAKTSDGAAGLEPATSRVPYAPSRYRIRVWLSRKSDVVRRV
jgi:hypothetical protein